MEASNVPSNSLDSNTTMNQSLPSIEECLTVSSLSVPTPISNEIHPNDLTTVSGLVQDMEEKLKIPSKISVDEMEWMDVTQLLEDASKELKVGELLHSSDFNLFDSMSALELMDPKMDAGMLINNEPIQSISTRLQTGELSLTFNHGIDILATINFLLRCQASWYDGQSLSQTFLTCLYIHDECLDTFQTQFCIPTNEKNQKSVIKLDETKTNLTTFSLDKEKIQSLLISSRSHCLQLILYTYCICLLKTIGVIRNVIIQADLYEEEDFIPSTYGMSFAENISENTFITLMELLETHLKQFTMELKKNKSKKNKKKKASIGNTTSSSTLEGLEDDPNLSKSVASALLLRLQYGKTMYQAYRSMESPSVNEIEGIRKRFSSALSLIQSFIAEEIEMDEKVYAGQILGFDEHITRLLASTAPPRRVQIMEKEKALKVHSNLLLDMDLVCSAPQYRSLEDFRRFLHFFSRRNPNIVARSFLLNFLYVNDKVFGQYSFMDWLKDSMFSQGVPSILVSTEEGAHFSTRVIKPLYDSLKIYLHNRSRQRRRIEFMLEDWSILQMEAAAIDERFIAEMEIPRTSYPRYFTAWTMEKTLVLLIHYVLLGVELELFDQSEYISTFWYLDYLLGARIQNLNITSEFMNQFKKHTSSNSKEPSGNKSRKGKKKNKSSTTSSSSTSTSSTSSNSTPTSSSASSSSSAAKEQSDFNFNYEIAWMEAYRSVGRGIFQYLSSLELEYPECTKRQSIYGSIEKRFQHRFLSFSKLQYPPPLSYEDFIVNSDFSKYKPTLVYKSSTECFKMARLHIEKVMSYPMYQSIIRDEMHDLAKGACTNGVNIMRMNTSSNEASTTTKHLTIDFSSHLQFPIIQYK